MKTTKTFKTIGLAAVFFLEFSVLAQPLYADTMPTKEQLSSQITSQAQAQTSTINADTSSAPQASTTVTNTGNNTSTSTTSQSSSTTTVNNQNTATVNQTTNAVANTGNNDASRNISIGGNAGVISTGNATTNSTSVTAANNNNTAISGSSGGAGASTTGTNTGNNVTTSTSSDNTSTTLVNNGNTTTINQTTNALANTGGNTAARNISIGGSAGVITTGNASTNTNSLVTANGSVMLIGGSGNGNGPGSGASIVLANAGDAARFTSLANNTSYMVVNNDNRATIAQTCGAPLGPNTLLVSLGSCVANTGGNNSSRNIAHGGDAGVIHTGDAVLNVFMIADANSNRTRLSFTPPGSGATSDILNTGDNANTTTGTNNANSTTVNNTNSGDINQTVNAVANTGNNTADRNISFGGNAGVIRTGNATVNTFMGAAVNSNTTIEIQPAVVQGTSSDPYALILNTGSSNTFNSSTNNTNTTGVNNNNLLSLTQNFIGNINTGLNNIVGSIGTTAGIISTGNAMENVSLNVMANNNQVLANEGQVTSQSNGSVPTPTPDASSASLATPTPTPIAAMTGTTENGSSQKQTTYTYYYSYNTTSGYPDTMWSYYPYSFFNRFYPRYSSPTTLLTNMPIPGNKTAGTVLGINSSALTSQTPQTKVAWVLLSILSSIVGIGVYISRNSFFDPRLYA